MSLLADRPLPQVLSFLLVAGIIGLFTTYALYQARYLLTGPVVTLTDEPAAIQHERTITLSGRAQNITAISINDRPISTSETGYFTEPIVLENGYTIVSVTARDRYGRSHTTNRSFVYVPQSPLPINL